MADGSIIEWLQRPGTRPATWNPIRARRLVDGPGAPRTLIGWHCEPVSAACANCYSERQNLAGARGGTRLPYKPGHRGREAELYLDEATLGEPLRWRDPRTIFVCSMTDLFGPFVADGWIRRIFAVMALARRHTFIVLTKRPERQRTCLTDRSWLAGVAYEVGRAAMTLATSGPKRTGAVADGVAAAGDLTRLQASGVGLPNVWGGTSCGDQADADRFVPDLIVTPLTVRLVSAEPLLGPIDFRPWLERIDWIIAGGESGPHARPMHPDWARSIRDQCQAGGTAFFFKQWGEWAPVCEMDDAAIDALYHPAPASDPSVARRCRVDEHVLHVDGSRHNPGNPGAFRQGTGAMTMFAAGKRRAGRALDGRHWSEFPDPHAPRRGRGAVGRLDPKRPAEAARP